MNSKRHTKEWKTLEIEGILNLEPLNTMLYEAFTMFNK